MIRPCRKAMVVLTVGNCRTSTIHHAQSNICFCISFYWKFYQSLYFLIWQNLALPASRAFPVCSGEYATFGQSGVTLSAIIFDGSTGTCIEASAGCWGAYQTVSAPVLLSKFELSCLSYSYKVHTILFIEIEFCILPHIAWLLHAASLWVPLPQGHAWGWIT